MEELDPSARPFDPFRDDEGRVVEPRDEYVQRMRRGALSAWPSEVIEEWLYRHAGHVCRYSFLGFEYMVFRREAWTAERIPGSEAFLDPTFVDTFGSVLRRAEDRHDWLARFMAEHGTWNTPILLLETPDGLHTPSGLPLRAPHHLLEGHRRLAFFIALRDLGQAAPFHDVWIVDLRSSRSSAAEGK